MGLISKIRRIFRNAAMDSGDIERVMRAGNEVSSGVSVNSDSAMRCTAVFACVRVLAESVAQLPRIIYKRQEDGGKERQAKHPLSRMLDWKPNHWQTGFEFFEMMMGHLCLRGNAYAHINRVGMGEVAELIPLHPDKVEVSQDKNLVMKYVYFPDGATPRVMPPGSILHVRGLSSDGIKGLNPIEMARESVGLALVAEKHGARTFKNGAQPGGVLKHPQVLSEKAREALRQDFAEKYSGAGNAGSTILLEEGMDFVKVGMTSEDAQFLETRKFQRSDIAGIFRVPPHMIGDLDKATFSNIEHQAIEFVTGSLLPWLKRWEQAVRRDLIAEPEQDSIFLEFLVDGLLRGDTKTRYEAHNMAVMGGWKRRNEVRIQENLNPIDGLDELLTPLNMAVGSRPQDAEKVKFEREVVRAFIADGTVADVIANSTDIGTLVTESGLPRNAAYQEPYLPVVSEAGPMVSGEVITDSAGDVVGGDVVESPAAAGVDGNGPENQQPGNGPDDANADQAKDAASGNGGGANGRAYVKHVAKSISRMSV